MKGNSKYIKMRGVVCGSRSNIQRKRVGCAVDANQEFYVREFSFRILKGVINAMGEYWTNTTQTQKMGSAW